MENSSKKQPIQKLEKELNQESNSIIKKSDEDAHVCPHCGLKSYLINDHFNHIDLFHDSESLF